jgi:PKD repeat protein
MRSFTSVAATLAALTLVGCTVHQTETPALSGPSDLALSMSVSSSPQTITQNGADVAVVAAKVYFTDPKTGNTSPKANIPVRFDMAINGVPQDFGTLSARSAVTGSDGIARTTYTAPPMPVGGNTGSGCNSMPGQCVSIVATATDTTVASSAGATASGSATIALVPQGAVLPPAGTPKATFTFLPSSVNVGQSVTFDASASCATDPSGNCSAAGSITSYQWTFGDGATGSGKTVTHTFSAANTFLATLTVTSDRGVAASTSQQVTVGLPAAPSAEITVSPDQPVAGQTVFFSADTSKAAPGHNITQFSWNFGDGTTDSGIAVSHTFVQPGTYKVILSITDDTGQRATAPATVQVGNPGPVAKLTLTKAGAGGVVADASLSTPTNSVAIATYSFNFGDGTGNTPGSGSPIANHSYVLVGTYTVTVIVTDLQGHSSTTSAIITLP